jgi:CHAT domain-containing protein
LVNNLKIYILLFIAQFSYSQNKFDQLVSAFDNYNSELKLELISEFENNPSELEKLNIIDFNLFKLIKLESIGYEEDKYFTKEYSDYFKESIDFLIDKNLMIDFLPYFLIKYTLIYNNEGFLKNDNAIEYLKLAIQVEEQNKNLSRYPSIRNLYTALEVIENIDENQDKYLIARFNLFKENKEILKPFLIPYRINSIINLLANVNSRSLLNYTLEKELVNYILDLSIENIDNIGNSEVSLILEMAIDVKKKEGLNVLTLKFSETIGKIDDTDSLDYYFLIISGYQYYKYIERWDFAHAMVLEVMNHKVYKNLKPILNEDSPLFSNDPSIFYDNFSEIDNILIFEFRIISDFINIGMSPYVDSSRERLFFFTDYVLERNNYFYKIRARSKANYESTNRLFTLTKYTLLFQDQKFNEILALSLNEELYDNKKTRYVILRYRLIANYKLDNINYNDFINKLESIRNEFNIEMDAIDFIYLDSNINSIRQRIVNIQNKLIDLDFINNLSYENQIRHIEGLYSDFDLLIGDVLENELDNHDLLLDIFQILIDIDNIDKYNSKLLNLNEDETNKYFELLSERKDISTSNILSFNKKIFEFDSFQQKIKSKFRNDEKLLLTDFQNKFNDNEAYLRIFKKLGYNENDLDAYVGFLYYKNGIALVKYDIIEFEKIRDFYTSSIINDIDDNLSYKYLFSPIELHLPESISTIFIKNDGIFNNINLETLKLSDTKIYLIDNYQIDYVETPNSIFNTKPIEFSSAFLFGNPLFSDTQNNNFIRSRVSQLPNTKIEIDEINKLLIGFEINSIKTDGEESNEQNLYANSNKDIIHIATHGFFGNKSVIDGRSNRFNWGLLASNYDEKVLNMDSDQTNSKDGVIHGGEIIYQNFTKNNLLILSACETGVGESLSLGTESLANAFLRAGSKNIISTLWPVDDEVTKNFMIEFYKNLLVDSIVKNALLKTKQKFKEIYPPKYWGAFVLLSNQTM